MLNDLKWENLQLRRTSLRLVFLYKVVEGLVPTINPSEFLVKSKPKRKIKPKLFDNFESCQFRQKQFLGTRDYCVQYWAIQELILRQKYNSLEPAGRRDSACKDSWELQNSSPTPTIGALSTVELKPASGIFDVLIQIQGLVTTV
jgi:hypothetical protein